MKAWTVLFSVLALLVFLVACGGRDKPPLTPDSDGTGMGDGGTDMPTNSPAAPPTPK